MNLKKLIKYAIICCCSLVVMQSCIQDKYDTNDLNKTIQLKIPPVPLGSLDTIFINFLPSIPPEIEIGIGITLSDTIKGVFDQRTISRFFYEGSGDVVITGQMDVIVTLPNSGLKLDLLFHIIDTDGQRNEFVQVPMQTLVYGQNQTFEIRIRSEYMKYMQNARDVQFVLSFNVSAINFTKEDYIYIRNFVLHTGGIQLEL